MVEEKSQTDWHGATVQTESTPETMMVDEGKGKPYVLRIFEFVFSPDFLKQRQRYGTPVVKQELFNQHWRQMRSVLWSDGLVAREDIQPRIIVGKKKYKIFLMCEPRLGVMVAERPQTLQDIFKK